MRVRAARRFCDCMSEHSGQHGSSQRPVADCPAGVAPAARAPAAVGSLADMVAAPRDVSFSASFPTQTLVKIAILAGLLALLNRVQLDWLVRKWLADSDWTHGFVIPLFSLYLLYTRREDLFAARRRTSAWGLVIMLMCLAGEILALYPGRNYWLSQICMVGVLFGLVLYLAGAAAIRVTWLPILFLVFMIPISPRVYTAISLPLQNLAAKGAVAIFKIMRVQITSAASAMELISRSGQVRELTVAEACSGMKLLMAFLALGVAMAYLDYKPLWQRIILVAAAIPIAIFCNVIRVAITTWMFYIDKPDLGQDFMHYFTGMLMLIPAFGLLWLLSWILRNIFVEQPPEEQAGAAGAEGRA